MSEQESVKLKRLCSNAIIAQAGHVDASTIAYQELFAYIDCFQALLDSPLFDTSVKDDILQQIEAYSKEIGLRDSMSIKELIDSHRQLRNWNNRRTEEWAADREAESKRAYEDAKTYALENEYFSKERLKSMTLIELSKILLK